MQKFFSVQNRRRLNLRHAIWVRLRNRARTVFAVLGVAAALAAVVWVMTGHPGL